MTARLTPLSDLVPAAWNPRTIKDHRFANLCKSIAADPDFLRLRPILAMVDGTIYAGNMRWRAAKHLGHADVWAIVEDVPEQLAKERALRDNAGWGENVDDQVGALLAELKTAGSDIDLLGFDSGELDRLLAGVTQLDEEELTEADLEPPAEPTTKPGDLWLLGEHRLLCGDSTNITDVERLMNGRKADMVFTDPPYGVAYDGGTKVREALAGDDSTDLYAPACMMATLHTTKAAPLYLWHAGVKGIAAAAAAAAAAAGYEIRCEIVWNKNQAQFGALSAQYKQKHEPAYYCFKRGQTASWYGPTNEVTVWDVDRASVNEYHPTQKPIELATRAMGNSSKRRDVVLDLFGGSGSTMMAAQQTGRVAYLMEIDPGYCDVIVRRWEKLTGKTAVLETEALRAAA